MKQFDLVAITDHDRVDTVAAIQQLALEKHLPVLVGVEMSTAVERRNVRDRRIIGTGQYD